MVLDPTGSRSLWVSTGIGRYFQFRFQGLNRNEVVLLAATRSTLIQIADRLHDRVVVEIFGEDKKE